MLKNKTFKELKKIAEKYNIPVKLKKGYRDGGETDGETIWLYPTKKPWIREMSFWHELGHIMLTRMPDSWGYTMSTISYEGAAWEIGLKYAAQHGRKWPYHYKELRWARKQLTNYIGSESDFLPYTEDQLSKARNVDDKDKLKNE